MLMNSKFFVESSTLISRAYAKKLQKELVISQVVEADTLEANPEKKFFAYILRGITDEFFRGSKHKKLFTVVATIKEPRVIQVEIPISKIPEGGAYGGILYYSTLIPIPLQGEISFNGVRFSSLTDGPDTTLAKRINANSALLNMANSFARTAGKVAGYSLSAPRYFQMIPQDGGCLLKVATFPIMTMFGFSCSLRAQEFVTLTGAIEKTLQGPVSAS